MWLHGGNGERLARREEVKNLQRRIEKALVDHNYQRDPSRMEQSMRSVGNILHRQMLTTNEVDLLHGILTCIAYPRRVGEEEVHEESKSS